ncbi:cellular tumor antigen p53 isoform X2 [Episyrphus balteatus]|uniref:cellular tumor antigen p53 isoform X2 n=1 Tax=Episyrphus balteatus TaxID=286459 RepID=UPI002486AD7B|nr:cellular tumor antigen p53 isoform X2 [Episyrphus balteatus]
MQCSIKVFIMVISRRSQSLSQLIEQECAENPNPHPNLNQVLPDLQEHDKYGLNFELNLNGQQKGKVNWFYSETSNKVYIKLNEIFNVEVVYKPRSSNEKIFIRTMMVFNSEVSEPVVRCENHSSKDPALEKNIKHSVLRCENPNVIYQGTVEGKNISDRLSVRIPLGCVQPDGDEEVKQTVALKFVCQNSCVGRRETSIIFYMENANGEVLAKRITNVKICSCPKRDMRKDEETQMPKKRSRKDECPIGKKIAKVDSEIKIEPKQEEDDEEDSFSGSTETNDIVMTPNGGVRITMELPDMEAANHVYECAFNKVAGQMALKPESAIMYARIIKALKKSYAKSRRLTNEPQK